MRTNTLELLAFIDVAIFAERLCEQLDLSPGAMLALLKRRAAASAASPWASAACSGTTRPARAAAARPCGAAGASHRHQRRRRHLPRRLRLFAICAAGPALARAFPLRERRLGPRDPASRQRGRPAVPGRHRGHPPGLRPRRPRASLGRSQTSFYQARDEAAGLRASLGQDRGFFIAPRRPRDATSRRLSTMRATPTWNPGRGRVPAVIAAHLGPRPSCAPRSPAPFRPPRTVSRSTPTPARGGSRSPGCLERATARAFPSAGRRTGGLALVGPARAADPLDAGERQGRDRRRQSTR